MVDNELSFSIKSGLKNIIGRDLITDDYVAVFELVKNSFDAHAKKVTISFKKDKIVITDDGKGMELEDIKSKWLAVAYSAKTEGTEDIELKRKEFKSYRDKINSKKVFAGAKGIGRFSCDRLGNNLLLTSKSASTNAKVEQIEIDWKDFDNNPKKEFVDVKVKHRTIQQFRSGNKKMEHGTILEISNLNSKWNREKKLTLRHSLEKLINPFEDNPLNGFSIEIEDETEIINDKKEQNLRNKINGAIKNFVFETLKIKTTQVFTELDSEGHFITITLFDRGTLVYKIKRKNNTNPKLSNITFRLFHLNRIAKLNFTKLMGLEPIHFGSVFLYKNGFRVSPYGDVGFDYFGLDTRKTQKHFDLLGSRDLIGRIEIVGNNPYFKESTSRDGGLVRNEYYYALVKCFIDECLKKLENYLNKVQWTTKDDKDKEDLSALDNILAKSALLKLISKEIDDDETKLLDLDRENLNIRAQKILSDATEKDINSLKIIANKLQDKSFIRSAITIEREHQKLLDLQIALKKLEKEKIDAENAAKDLEEKLEIEREKNTYLKTSTRSLSDDAKGLVHNIKITTRAINSNVDTLYFKAKSGSVNNDELLRRLGTIKFNSEKALKIAKLITRSNFKAQQNEQIVDVVKYISQYLEVYSDMYEKNQLEFIVKENNSSLIKKVSVLDISVILDDLISNAEKAGANKVLVEMHNPNSKSLRLVFSDSGKGVPKKYLNNPEEIFELGVTTTDGSGIGLHSVKSALKNMNGSIKFIGNNFKLKGAAFEIMFK